MDTCRLGFIGSGFVARFHAMALQQAPQISLSAVHKSGGAAELAGLAEKTGLGPCKICHTVAEVCENCDVAVILTPNDVRLDVLGEIIDAVKAGAGLKGMACEKPLGRTVVEAREMVRLARQVNIPNAYLENQLHMRAIRTAVAQLALVQRKVGPLLLARSSEEHAGPHKGWFWDPTRQGGGVLCDMGCHSIAVGWFVLTPYGQGPRFLEPVSVTAQTLLLKWGQEPYRRRLLDEMGVDYAVTPAEDFCTGAIQYRNPETGRISVGQFTNSWMYDKQGLRVSMEGMGPGYAFEINSLRSPLEVFVGDAAAQAVTDAEKAVEKSTASRGLLAVHPNEADLYGYTSQFHDVRDSFRAGKDGLANFEYGLEITKLCQAAYMSAEQGKTIDLTLPAVQEELESYTSLIAQGRGAQVLY